MEMALVWHEKARSTALQTGSLLHTNTLLVQTQMMFPPPGIKPDCFILISSVGTFILRIIKTLPFQIHFCIEILQQQTSEINSTPLCEVH